MYILYPFEIPGRLSELNLLDYSAQVIEESSIDDLDPNERIRLRNIITQTSHLVRPSKNVENTPKIEAFYYEFFSFLTIEKHSVPSIIRSTNIKGRYRCSR